MDTVPKHTQGPLLAPTHNSSDTEHTVGRPQAYTKFPQDNRYSLDSAHPQFKRCLPEAEVEDRAQREPSSDSKTTQMHGSHTDDTISMTTVTIDESQRLNAEEGLHEGEEEERQRQSSSRSQSYGTLTAGLPSADGRSIIHPREDPHTASPHGPL